MPLSSRIVGMRSAAFAHTIDARWLMAYAAGLGETAACYFDTTRAIHAHPVFPVCVEWDPILDLRFGEGARGMDAAEQASAVHADHDIHLYAPIRPGMSLSTTATAIALEARKPGAYLLKRLDTVDDTGRLVARTYQGTLYRGVGIADGEAAIDAAPPWPAPAGGTRSQDNCAVPMQAAHVYTECARIWNPIHTDRAHAVAAGLPDIILHGTATLALAVSRVVDACLGGDSLRVVRLGGRFSGMVRMPATLMVSIDAGDASGIGFAVHTDDGTEVMRKGFVVAAD